MEAASSGDWAARIAELVATAEAEAERIRADAEQRADERIAEAERIRKEADDYATLVRANAEEEARGLTREARFAAQAVLSEGNSLHDDLQELSKSMRRNAERLINDVRDAHARLAGEIDRTVGPDPASSSAGRSDRAPRRASVDFGDDVPEFMP
jgi:vacuolar-type H+-ATPase subunit H